MKAGFNARLFLYFVVKVLLFAPIGFLYLWIRGRSKSKVQQLKKDDFHDSFFVAGLFITGRIFLVGMIGLLLMFLSVMVYRMIVPVS